MILKRAKKLAERNVVKLFAEVSDHKPLVGIEPSAILGFRDEFPLPRLTLKGEKSKGPEIIEPIKKLHKPGNPFRGDLRGAY